ncbi:hypothetical protein [Parvularcula lutaonensis]|uniref:Uncharacterized protein n=1 Tax=Parvularcula lutaonensis TaxID=491923 RepID=A0ABV7MBZ8_9PROT|nr:hypothetical protein [Parvularcula lutaonensis]GGY49094.1 hypothetical protein GCM10007148_17000 [Parvularcula lutaonensis]
MRIKRGSSASHFMLSETVMLTGADQMIAQTAPSVQVTLPAGMDKVSFITFEGRSESVKLPPGEQTVKLAGRLNSPRGLSLIAELHPVIAIAIGMVVFFLGGFPLGFLAMPLVMAYAAVRLGTPTISAKVLEE